MLLEVLLDPLAREVAPLDDQPVKRLEPNNEVPDVVPLLQPLLEVLLAPLVEVVELVELELPEVLLEVLLLWWLCSPVVLEVPLWRWLCSPVLLEELLHLPL